MVTGTLGRGAFGRVYRIERDLYGIREEAALKIIRIPKDSETIEDLYSAGYSDESVREWCRTRRDDINKEYALMSKLKGHTNIVSCDDIAVISHTDDPGYDIYIRMELLKPLPKILKEKELTDQDIIRIGVDICRALVVCEKYNIIHRDIKPQNILMNDTGDYKLGDFGVARTMEHTTNATVAGTETYMAPEVVKREKYFMDADTYSLGLVLYWLLNNRTMPFLPVGTVPQISELEAARRRRLSGDPLPLPVNGSRRLKLIVMKACQYDRSKRYRSASEMLRDLSPLLYSAAGTSYSAAASFKPVVDNADDYGSDEKTVGMFGWKNYDETETVVEPETQDKTERMPADRKPTTPDKPAATPKQQEKPQSWQTGKSPATGKPGTGSKPQQKKQTAKKPAAQKKPAATKPAEPKKPTDNLMELWPYALGVAAMIYIVCSRYSEVVPEDRKILLVTTGIVVAGFLALILPGRFSYIGLILSFLSGFVMVLMISAYAMTFLEGGAIEWVYKSNLLFGALILGMFIAAVIVGVRMGNKYGERHQEK